MTQLPDLKSSGRLCRCRQSLKRKFAIIDPDCGKPWRRQHAQLFRRAVAKAGLPRQLVFHCLRHTYASDLIRAGVPIEVVAKQLGHANSMTVSNTYGHLAEQFREEQVRQRFTVLSSEHCREAHRKASKLRRIWSNVQTADWREYAAVGRPGSSPRKSFASPAGEVIELFEDAERSCTT